MLLVRSFGLVLLLTARRRIDPKPLEVPKGKSSNRSCSLRIVNTGVTAGSPISIQFVGGNSLNATLRHRHGDTIHLHQLLPHKSLLQLLHPGAVLQGAKRSSFSPNQAAT